MTTFAKATFDASTYSTARPTYPPEIFEQVFSYHKAGLRSSRLSKEESGWDRAVDVGCGTGQATLQLKPFHEVIGIDPSPVMLSKARTHVADSNQGQTPGDGPTYTFLQGSSENMRAALPGNAERSVDLVVSAEAAHWFDWSKLWPEASHILRQGGTAAFWIYGEFRLADYPSNNPLITSYMRGTDPAVSIGPYFERPGRTILERLLVDVPEPTEECGLAPVERIYFVGDNVPSFIPDNAQTRPVLMRKTMRWRDVLSYLRTISALHTYHEQRPEDLEREEDTRFLEQDLASSGGSVDELRGGDISIRFWKDLRQGALAAMATAQVGADDDVLVEWPMALLLTRKL